jgi:hypothetical protein
MYMYLSVDRGLERQDLLPRGPAQPYCGLRNVLGNFEEKKHILIRKTRQLMSTRSLTDSIFEV